MSSISHPNKVVWLIWMNCWVVSSLSDDIGLVAVLLCSQKLAVILVSTVVSANRNNDHTNKNQPQVVINQNYL